MSDGRPPLWLRWFTAASVLVSVPLAGLLAGGIAGFALGLVAVRLLGPRGRLAVAGIAVIGAMAAILYLRATSPSLRPPPAAAVPETPSIGISPRRDG